MAKVIVTYDQPKNKEGFEQHYFDVHIPLARKMPNLKTVNAHRVLQSVNTNDNPFLIAVLEFDNVNDLNLAMSSPEGKEAQDDLVNLLEFLNRPPVISIVE